VVECNFLRGELVSIKFRPIVLNEEGTKGELFYQTRGVLQLAEGEVATAILKRLSVISRTFDTNIKIADDYAEIRVE